MHPADLLDAVGAEQRGEHGLVEAGEQNLDLAVGGQRTQAVEIGRLVLLQPLEERAGEVEHDGQKPAARQPVEQGPVDVLHVLGEDVVEVAHRLVQMQAEDEADGGHESAEDQ